MFVVSLCLCCLPLPRHVLTLSTCCGTGASSTGAPCQDHGSPAVPGTAPGAPQSPAACRGVLSGAELCWVGSAGVCALWKVQQCAMACSRGGSQHTEGHAASWEWLQSSRNGHSCQDPFSSPGARGSSEVGAEPEQCPSHRGHPGMAQEHPPPCAKVLLPLRVHLPAQKLH